MTIEEALETVEQTVAPRQLSKIQRLVFQHTWQGLSYLEIARATEYNPGYIKDTGSKLWQMLSESLGEKVTKQNVQAILKRYIRQTKEMGVASRAPASSISQAAVLHPSQDWGEAVDASIFYNRSSELATLSEWIVQARCRLVAILGMGGVGKTTLSVKLAEQVQGEFEFLIWRSLRDAPPLDELLTTLLRFLSKDNSPLPESLSGKLSRLQEYLRAARCLIVLDNFDAVFTPSQRVGVYRQGYEGYGELLRRVGEAHHQSCFILTSRETPSEIAALQGESLPVRELQLQGLEENAAFKLLTAKGLEGSAEELNQLMRCYQGNPLALKIAATSIQSLFAGSIADFLQQGVTVFSGIRHLLKQQVERLSDREQQVMYWLAINREPVGVSELQSDIVPTLPTSVLLETLESLRGRSLIEATSIGFTQQPVVMEYMTEQFIEKAFGEIVTEEIQLLIGFALIKAQAKNYIRESQNRIILEPIISKICTNLRIKEIEYKLEQILLKMREECSTLPGYGNGNVINLLRQLKIDLTGYDFSHLTVWQAHLQDANLRLP